MNPGPLDKSQVSYPLDHMGFLMFLAYIKDVIHTKFEMLLGSEGLLYYMASTVLAHARRLIQEYIENRFAL